LGGGQSPPSPPPGIDATVYRCINEFTDQDNSCFRKFVCEVNQCYRSVGLSFAAVFARCRHTKAAQATTLPVLVEVQAFTLWTFPFGHFPTILDIFPLMHDGGYSVLCCVSTVNKFISHFDLSFLSNCHICCSYVSAVLLLVLLLKFAYF